MLFGFVAIVLPPAPAWSSRSVSAHPVFLRQRHPPCLDRSSPCATATAACGSQHVIAMARYIAIAVERSARACSRWPVMPYSVPRPRWPWAWSGRLPRSSARARAWRSWAAAGSPSRGWPCAAISPNSRRANASGPRGAGADLLPVARQARRCTQPGDRERLRGEASHTRGFCQPPLQPGERLSHTPGQG